jgi:hypothetical protein
LLVLVLTFKLTAPQMNQMLTYLFTFIDCYYNLGKNSPLRRQISLRMERHSQFQILAYLTQDNTSVGPGMEEVPPSFGGEDTAL